MASTSLGTLDLFPGDLVGGVTAGPVAVPAAARRQRGRRSGAPISSRLVAALLNTRSSRPRSAASFSATRSAIGERQMLPQQTKTRDAPADTGDQALSRRALAVRQERVRR